MLKMFKMLKLQGEFGGEGGATPPQLNKYVRCTK